MIQIEMEVPKNCYECPMNKGEYSPAEIEKRSCCLLHEGFKKKDYTKRKANCPIKTQ